MAVGRDQTHSILEVVSQQRLPFDQERELAFDEGLQLALDDGNEWTGNKVNSGQEIASQENIDRQNTQFHQVLAKKPSARTWIKWGGISGLILLIILGSVLGGVLGARHQASVTASSTSPSSSSAPSPSVTPTQRNIAAVSFTSDSANTSRVYFQDNEGQIIEASSFEPDITWSISKIGIKGKNGSAIAAAVSLPSHPLVGPVFFCQ